MTTPDDTDQAPDDAPSYDPLAELTIGEIDSGSRMLKASLVHAITERTVDYGKALAITLWLHQRREDPAAKLQPLLALTYTELSEQLGQLSPQLDGEGPTPPGHG